MVRCTAVHWGLFERGPGSRERNSREPVGEIAWERAVALVANAQGEAGLLDKSQSMCIFAVR